MRRQARQWALVVSTSALMILFQNCGKPMSVAEHGSDSAEAVESNLYSLAVYPTVSPDGSTVMNKAQDSSSTGSGAREVRYVVPSAIDFGFNTSTGQRLDKARFRLDLKSGDVTENGTQRLLLSLQADEMELVKVMFEGSAIANAADFLPADTMCILVYKFAYAEVITDEGDFKLGQGGVCDSDDLYRSNSGQRAGLEQFLSKLATKLR